MKDTNMAESDASLDGATESAMGGMSKADARRGYKVLDKSHDDGFGLMGPREDSDGTTHVGDPWTRGGFLNRPRGFER